MGATEMKSNKRKSPKGQAIMQLILLLGIIVLTNIVSSFVFTRVDLTDDNRFTLSDNSKKLVSQLKDVVYVRVYLEGDFSPGFSRLQQSTREILDELSIYSNGNLQFEFIDPSANPDEKERNKFYAQLYQKGIQPTTVEERTNEGTKRTYIFPGALVSYANVEMSITLLKNQNGFPPELILNNSIQNLEYEICNVIRKVTDPMQPTIAFLEGQGELDTTDVNDIATALKASYELKRVRIDGKLNALKDYQAVVIAKPDSAFSEKDKFVIDQYVMHGGKLIFLLDPIQASMDSLERRGEILAPARDLKLDDMLFRYGARVNYDLVQDLLSSLIPVVTGMVGSQPKQQLLPWYFFPLMNPTSKHPIVNNLNSIKGQFVSSIDPIEATGIKHTVLLTTSQYSRILPAPVRVSLGIMQFKPDPKMFPQKDVPVAVMMEGSFTSLFKNRIPPAIAESKEIDFKDSSVQTKVVVISDGDLIRNDIVKGSPVALGFDRYTNTTYGNKSFFLNIMDYFCDDSGLMSVRSKEFRLRMIDPAVLEADTTVLKWFNVTLPIILLLVFGLIKFYLRLRRYT
ncbi:MAG: gliding motility-associated ABC transporter substrate-binding protein GldG [Bacteroidia bacterium]|nr:gliding motility-associated ABC transporter substrate-binding protein GldG [Bacteroidia bacterium]MBP7243759.1 gliding motility-associated ABC transporter substrate-binding protein GldG [Bacteroidia bacterium]